MIKFFLLLPSLTNAIAFVNIPTPLFVNIFSLNSNFAVLSSSLANFLNAVSVNSFVAFDTRDGNFMFSINSERSSFVLGVARRTISHPTQLSHLADVFSFLASTTSEKIIS